MALTRYVLIAYACVYVARAQYGSPSAETGSSSYGSGSPASPSSGGYGGSNTGMSSQQSYGGSLSSNQASGSSGYGSMSSSGYGSAGIASGSGSSGYGSGSYGGGDSYYTAPPTKATTVSPVSTTGAVNPSCPGSAPIGCRFQALIDPITGNILICLLVCDQPVTSTATTLATTTTTAPVTSTTTTTTTTTTNTTPVDPQAQIEACIASGRRPGTGCSFNGAGELAPTLTCPIDCVTNPAIDGPCNPAVGSIIQRCLCQTGGPGDACSYNFQGTLSPLTCGRTCGPPPFGR